MAVGLSRSRSNGFTARRGARLLPSSADPSGMRTCTLQSRRHSFAEKYDWGEIDAELGDIGGSFPLREILEAAQNVAKHIRRIESCDAPQDCSSERS